MKKIILSIATIMISAAAYAQTDSIYTAGMQSDKNNFAESEILIDSENRERPNGFMFRNGAMFMVNNGKITQLANDTTLTNGTVIMSNGSYMKEGGSKMSFKDGEHMDMSGNITEMDNATNMENWDSENYPDGYLFQNGKVIELKDGERNPVDEDVTLSNGTVIMSNGNYMKNGESEMQFNEGEHMDMSGKVTDFKDARNMKNDEKSKWQKGTHQKTDSTKNKGN